MAQGMCQKHVYEYDHNVNINNLLSLEELHIFISKF